MGKNVAMGLVNGIKDGIGAAGDAISGMADTVKNKFKGWLGINSPSRVFAGYGLNVAEGAAIGIRNGQKQAMAASASLAASAKDGWTPPALAPVEARYVLRRPEAGAAPAPAPVFPARVSPSFVPDSPRRKTPPELLQKIRLERVKAPAGSLPTVRQRIALTPAMPSPVSLPVHPDMAAVRDGLSRLAAWGKSLFAGLLPSGFPAMPLKKATDKKRTEAPTPDRWTPPSILTAPDSEARIARAQRAASSMTITFSPTVTIQGNADAKAVHEGLTLTLTDLKRMLARIGHDNDRRAYV